MCTSSSSGVALFARAWVSNKSDASSTVGKRNVSFDWEVDNVGS